MRTMIRKENQQNKPAPDDAVSVGPMMVWTGVRSAEDVKLMSDWASNRKKELSKKESSSNNG